MRLTSFLIRLVRLASAGGPSPTDKFSGPNTADRNPWLINPAWFPAMFVQPLYML